MGSSRSATYQSGNYIRRKISFYEPINNPIEFSPQVTIPVDTTALVSTAHPPRQLRHHHGVLHHIDVHGPDLRAEAQLRGGLEPGTNGAGKCETCYD